MKRLLNRLNADISDHYLAMIVYARHFNLPFVEEDLIEYMELWEENQIITISLVTDNIVFYEASFDFRDDFLFNEVIVFLS